MIISCSFTSLCGIKCDFSSRWPGWQQLIPLELSSCADSVEEHVRDVKEARTSVASEKELILARVGLFRDFVGCDFATCLKY